MILHGVFLESAPFHLLRNHSCPLAGFLFRRRLD